MYTVDVPLLLVHICYIYSPFSSYIYFLKHLKVHTLIFVAFPLLEVRLDYFLHFQDCIDHIGYKSAK